MCMLIKFPFEDKGFALESQLASKERKPFSFIDTAFSSDGVLLREHLG